MNKTRWGGLLGAAALLLGCAACGTPAPGKSGPPQTTLSAAATEPTAGEAADAAQTTDAVRTTETVRTIQNSTEPATTMSKATRTAVTVHDDMTGQPPGRLRGLEPAAALSNDFAAGYDAFALEFMQRAQLEGQNGFVSPASVYLALGMVTNGAAGKTAEELYAALGVSDGSALNRGCRDLQSRLNEKQFRLANGIWVNQKMASDILPAFTAVNREYFGARLAAGSFDDALQKEINLWVWGNTAGRIRDLLKEPLNPDGLMVLVNTLLFEGQWEEPFPEPQAGTFHGAQEAVTLPLMHTSRIGAPYYEDDEVQATRLAFAEADASMLFVLPKEEGTAVLDRWFRSLTAKELRTVAQCGDKAARLNLTVPKCRLSYDGELNDVLQAMGIQAAFRQGQADFSRMADGKSGLEPYMERVIHRTELEMDEKGVLAASAAAVLMTAASARPNPDEVKTICLDRPFFCALVDDVTGAVLFGGMVNQPQAV